MNFMKSSKTRRILMLVCGSFAIFFTGFPHIWSIYQPYLSGMTGWTQEQVSMCFYLAVGTFAFGNIIGGRIQDRFHPRISMLAGGGLFTAGVLLSAVVIAPSPFPMYLTYGVMQGFGQGMIYTTIVSTAQKWFPDKTGFASGIVIMSNGLCGFILAPVSKYLLEQGGPRLALTTIGLFIAVASALSVIFVVNPNPAPQSGKKQAAPAYHARQYTSSEMLRTKKFYFLLLTMLCVLTAYFMISPISQTLLTGHGVSSSAAVGTVMVGSVMNAGIRLLLPVLSDRFGRTVCVQAVTIISVAGMIMITTLSPHLLIISIVIMYACFGGIMGSFPSLCNSIFGMKYSGENYGYVLMGMVAATIGAPMIVSTGTAMGVPLQNAFLIGTAFCIIGAVSVYFLSIELKSDTKTIHKEVQVYATGTNERAVNRSSCTK